MAEKKSVNPKKKSVRDFQNEIRAEEVKMQRYGKKFDTSVNGLKNDWQKHARGSKEAGKKMIGEGITRMKEKVGNYNNEILNQKKKNEAAISKMKGSVNNLKNNWKKHGKELNEAAIQMRNQGINKMKEKVKGFNNEISNQKKENKAAISRMKGDVNLFISEIDGKRKDFESYAKGPFAGYIKSFWG